MYQYLVYLRLRFLLKIFLKANIFAVFLFVFQVDPALKEKLKQNTVTLESEYEVK